MSDTPATSFDPATGSDGDTDQLPREDTLVDRGVDDLLDEGYSPPERDNRSHYGETAWEEKHRETIDQRITQEEPEIWEAAPRVAGDREQDRAGRLSADDDAVEAGGTDAFARDEGVSGGAASAEEAAMHLVDEVYVDQSYRDED
ncbi:DUF5709 domain-containing protein [Cellulomonas persica]|uniref:DUF5709 domain-containing protein n=1 Tax=Cellulomonas persica TaxID=76861 RepID=A0A510UU52_9CELL|nr:DUF5709 domain-containing protein [Cellulomonas persica]GEK18158.1 hypothetical protein CPE01_18910 [Cellulomonas persica]